MALIEVVHVLPSKCSQQGSLCISCLIGKWNKICNQEKMDSSKRKEKCFKLDSIHRAIDAFFLLLNFMRDKKKITQKMVNKK